MIIRPRVVLKSVKKIDGSARTLSTKQSACRPRRLVRCSFQRADRRGVIPSENNVYPPKFLALFAKNLKNIITAYVLENSLRPPGRKV